MYVLIPCNMGNNSYWVIAMICLKKGKVVMYDSMVTKEESRRARAKSINPLVRLLRFLLNRSGYYDHISTAATAQKEWALEQLDPNMVKLSQQSDGYYNTPCY